MTYQGPVDPTSPVYVPGNPATYPAPTTDPLYQPGMWWQVVTAGTWDGVAVEIDDRIYVTAGARHYGDGTYGDGTYGDNLSDWLAATVMFIAWSSSSSPWDRPPKPYDGCLFGDRFPGWRVVVEAFYNADDTARTYGTDTYGSDVYGDVNGAGVEDWNDVTSPVFGVTIRRGSEIGEWVAPVDEFTFDIRDLAADAFPMSSPASWFAPGVGTMVRASLMSPTLQWFQLGVGRIERVTDRHDTPPRILTVDAYGLVSDLVTTIARWYRGSEPAVARLEALRLAAGWQWGPVDQYPTTPGPDLYGGGDPQPVVARDELDRVAISARWVLDTTSAGRLRYREWPLEPAGTPVEVVDCVEVGAPPGAVLSPVIEFVSDMATCLNYVEAGNRLEAHALAVDSPSVGVVGRRSEAYGFPLFDLDTVAVQGLADAVVDRLGSVFTRVASVEADTLVDTSWFEVLLALDTGQALDVTRLGIATRPLALDGVVVGFEHRLTPNRWRATINTRTTTPTI